MAKKSNITFCPLRISLVTDMVIETNSQLATLFADLIYLVSENRKAFDKAKGDLKEVGRLLKLVIDYDTNLRDLVADRVSPDTTRKFVALLPFDLTRLKSSQAEGVVRYLSILLDAYDDTDTDAVDLEPLLSNFWASFSKDAAAVAELLGILRKYENEFEEEKEEANASSVESIIRRANKDLARVNRVNSTSYRIELVKPDAKQPAGSLGLQTEQSLHLKGFSPADVKPAKTKKSK